MTRLEEFIEALTLIHKYDPDADFAAAHDEFWCGDTEDFSEEDTKRMEELGWDDDDGWHRFV